MNVWLVKKGDKGMNLKLFKNRNDALKYADILAKQTATKLGHTSIEMKEENPSFVSFRAHGADKSRQAIIYCIETKVE